MAADILLYDSDLVPVGRDQKQHVEVTRDIAIKINEQYGSVFKLPTPIIREEVATVPGLDGQKMSKSYGNTIDLFLEEKALLKKIRQMQTDSTPVEEPKDPTTSSIVALYRHFANESQISQMEADFRSGGIGYGEFKNRLSEAIWTHFAPMRERRDSMLREPDYVEKVLAQGREKAQSEAAKILYKVRSAVGLQRK
jgi:tryptophanyl-tRNA synthetase